MKWTIFFMIWLGANPALATVIRYEARDVVFQGPDFYPSIFQNCNATMRFSFDTVSEEVVDSSVTCSNLPLHLTSTGRSPITLTFQIGPMTGRAIGGIKVPPECDLFGRHRRAQKGQPFRVVLRLSRHDPGSHTRDQYEGASGNQSNACHVGRRRYLISAAARRISTTTISSQTSPIPSIMPPPIPPSIIVNILISNSFSLPTNGNQIRSDSGKGRFILPRA